MNLEESNEFVEELEKRDKKKKNTKIALLVCVIIIVVLFGIIQYLKLKDAKVLKMFIDGNQVGIAPELLIEEDGVRYMNVRRFAEMLGYSYSKGEYQSYDEDENCCNFTNGYEIVSLSADSDTFTKYTKNDKGTSEEKDTNTNKNNEEAVDDTQLILTDPETGEQKVNIRVALEDETKKIFSIGEPIKNVNGQLYVSFNELPRVFSVRLDNSNVNRIMIYDLNNMVNSAVSLATSNNYTTTSNYYENLIAMVDNMLIVGDGTNYGVISLIDGKEIISLKYENIVYLQNTKEFMVTAEGSVGIVSADGKTIVKPTEYDNISSLDELTKLYLVEKNKKYGVVNSEGETIVYPEYDSIGVENKDKFSKEDIRNYNLLFEDCIPVNKNGKVGIIDIDGEERLKCAYDSLGYIANQSNEDEDEDGAKKDNKNTSSTKKQTTYEDDEDSDEDENEENTVETPKAVEVDEHDNVLTIPESVGIKGIVVNLNGMYGIFDAEVKRLIVPCACTKIYSKTKSGKTTYYLEYNEQEIELESYLEINNLKSVNENTNSTDKNSQENLENEDNSNNFDTQENSDDENE